MTEYIEDRPLPLKGDLGERFSDADSGYEDPGVITVPVTRTIFRKDQRGRNVSTTSTEWISVPKSCEREDIKTKSSQSLAESISQEGLTKTPSSSLASLAFDGFKNCSMKSSKDVNQESSNQSMFSLDVLNPGVSTTSNVTVDNFDFDNFDFDISRFFKEHSKENENERRLRFLSTPRDKRGRGRPTLREINKSNKMVFKEETTRRTPRKKIRSKSADSAKRLRGPQSMFSPMYTKVLSPEIMKNRKMWADIVSKDCILEEEYYKVPYEACNREIILGRSSSSEALLYNFKRLRNKRLSDDYDGNYISRNRSLLPDTHNSRFGKNVITHKSFDTGNINSPKPNNILPFSLKPATLGELQPQPPEPVFQNEPSTEATDQLKQLIDDLNLVAYDAPNPKLQNEYGSERNSKLPLDEFCNNGVDVTSLDSDSGRSDSLEGFNNVNGGRDNDTQDNIEHQSIKQGRKKKAKKKVSFSNENEELIFDLTFSDSDSSSSVFEDRINEAESRAKKPTHLNDEFYLQSNDITDHDSFVKDSSVPHALNSFTPTTCSKNEDSCSKYKLNNDNDSGTQLISDNDCVPNYKPDVSFTDNLIRISEEKPSNYSLPPSSARNNNQHNNRSKIKNPRNKSHNVKPQKMNERPLNNFNANLFGFYSNSPSSYTRENDISEKKTNSLGNNLKGDKVNIYMTKGPSFTEHQIHLITSNSNKKPNITVSRFRVPFSSIRDQWEWALLLQHQQYKNQLRAHQNQRQDENENFVEHEKMIDNDCSPSPPSPFPRSGAFSPTSSCRSDASFSTSSSGCFSDPYSPPSSPFKIGKGTFPTSL